MAVTTSAERTVLVNAENRKVVVQRKPSSGDRTVYANED